MSGVLSEVDDDHCRRRETREGYLQLGSAAHVLWQGLQDWQARRHLTSSRDARSYHSTCKNPSCHLSEATEVIRGGPQDVHLLWPGTQQHCAVVDFLVL